MKQQPRNPNRLQFKGKNIIAEYLKAKEYRDNRLWKIVGNRFVTLFNGEWISLKEFEDMYPILKQNSLLTNMDNPNKTNNFSI